MHILRSWRTGLILVGLLLVVGLTATTSGWLGRPTEVSSDNQYKLALSRPTFLQAAKAADGFDIGAYLDQEAGISAWLYTAIPMNMTNAATAFRVIEDQTAEYIIGSVDVPNYDEHYDAHAYIHSDGYILAYYLNQDPVSKIINIKELSITSTKLESVVGIVAGAAGVPSAGITHYDFRYPSAQNILMVYENPGDGNDFTIEMPGTFAYYERGFARTHSYNSEFWLDGVNLTSTYGANNTSYGVISAAQLAPDVTHTLAVNSTVHGVLLIVYTEPPP
jgi:hypothetical protein